MSPHSAKTLRLNCSAIDRHIVMKDSGTVPLPISAPGTPQRFFQLCISMFHRPMYPYICPPAEDQDIRALQISWDNNQKNIVLNDLEFFICLMKAGAKYLQSCLLLSKLSRTSLSETH